MSTPAQNKQAYEYRKTPDKGGGLFAVRNLPKGLDLGEYKGAIIPDLGASSLDLLLGYTTAMCYQEDCLIDPEAMIVNSDLHLMNHSCDPNCEINYDGELPRLQLIKDVKKGQELTYVYGIGGVLVPQLIKRWRCLCGTAVCRGTMFDDAALKYSAKKTKAIYAETVREARKCALFILQYGPRSDLNARQLIRLLEQRDTIDWSPAVKKAVADYCNQHGL